MGFRDGGRGPRAPGISVGELGFGVEVAINGDFVRNSRVRAQKDDSVNMVRHDDEGVQQDGREPRGESIPNSEDDGPG